MEPRLVHCSIEKISELQAGLHDAAYDCTGAGSGLFSRDTLRSTFVNGSVTLTQVGYTMYFMNMMHRQPETVMHVCLAIAILATR